MRRCAQDASSAPPVAIVVMKITLKSRTGNEPPPPSLRPLRSRSRNVAPGQGPEREAEVPGLHEEQELHHPTGEVWRYQAGSVGAGWERPEEARGVCAGEGREIEMGMLSGLVRRVVERDGRLYEGDTPLRVSSNTDGLLVGCTFITWEAWKALKAKVARMHGEAE